MATVIRNKCFVMTMIVVNYVWIGYVIYTVMVYPITSQNSNDYESIPAGNYLTTTVPRVYASSFLHDCYRHGFYLNWSYHSHHNHDNGLTYHIQTLK